jgi:hypothetical protein
MLDRYKKKKEEGRKVDKNGRKRKVELKWNIQLQKQGLFSLW